MTGLTEKLSSWEWISHQRADTGYTCMHARMNTDNHIERREERKPQNKRISQKVFLDHHSTQRTRQTTNQSKSTQTLELCTLFFLFAQAND